VMEEEPDIASQEQATDLPSEELPRSLEEFLAGKCAPSAYFKVISKNRATPPDDESTRRAVEVALNDPHALSRAIEVVRAGADDKVEGRIRRAIMAFGSEIIRSSSPDHSEWGTRGTVSTDSEIGLLARGLRKARASKDKDAIVRAEAALLLGLSVGIARADFDVIGTLAAVNANIHEEKPTPLSAIKQMKRSLRRASTKGLENFALVNTIVAAKLEESRVQLAQNVEQNRNLRDQVRSLQEQIASHRERIVELEKDHAGVSAQLTEAHGHIVGVRGGAAHEMIEMKARSRQFLARNVKPALKDAEDALALDPPFVDVARERIKAVSSDVERELAWLNLSSE
jgi:hypothetical protein